MGKSSVPEREVGAFDDHVRLIAAAHCDGVHRTEAEQCFDEVVLKHWVQYWWAGCRRWEKRLDGSVTTADFQRGGQTPSQVYADIETDAKT